MERDIENGTLLHIFAILILMVIIIICSPLPLRYAKMHSSIHIPRTNAYYSFNSTPRHGVA